MQNKIKNLAECLKSPRNPLNNITLSKPPIQSAVLVLCYEDGNGEQIIFTRRSETVEHHKGQICFPGGVKDDLDGTLWQTALRETKEEIGLNPQKVVFVGELGNVFTPTGFKVTPFVGFAESPFEWAPSIGEIAEIFSVPISHLMNPKNLEMVPRNYFGREFLDPVFTFNNHQIWGATGRILMDFLEAWRS